MLFSCKRTNHLKESQRGQTRIPSGPFYNRKLPLSVLVEHLVSVRIQFSAPIFKTPKKKKYKWVKQDRNLQGQIKKKIKKARQLALGWPWSCRRQRREACVSCAFEIYLHHSGCVFWVRMALPQEEPHAPSVFCNGFTESNDSSLLLTTGAIPTSQNP